MDECQILPDCQQDAVIPDNAADGPCCEPQICEPPKCAKLCSAEQVAVTPSAEPTVRRCRIPPEARLRGARNGARVAAERRQEDAAAWVEDWPLWMILVDKRAEGLSLAQIADEFTHDGYETPQGKTRWHPAQVARILRRVTEKAGEFLEELQATTDELQKMVAMARSKPVVGVAGEAEEADAGK